MGYSPSALAVHRRYLARRRGLALIERISGDEGDVRDGDVQVRDHHGPSPGGPRARRLERERRRLEGMWQDHHRDLAFLMAGARNDAELAVVGFSGKWDGSYVGGRSRTTAARAAKARRRKENGHLVSERPDSHAVDRPKPRRKYLFATSIGVGPSEDGFYTLIFLRQLCGPTGTVWDLSYGTQRRRSR